MKIFKQIIAVVLICITCISLVGCFLPKNEELYSSSTEFSADDMRDISVVVKATSQNTIVSIDEDIELNLTYWRGCQYSSELVIYFLGAIDMVIYELDNKTEKSSLIIKKTIREIEDFTDERYSQENVTKEDSVYGKDTVIIKNEWLIGETGYIGIRLNAEGKYKLDQDNDFEEKRRAYINVYYFKTKNNILLFGHERDYNKYVKNNIFI